MSTEPKIQISLTQFADFLSLTGNARVSHVQKIKQNPDYSIVGDYYKKVREGIILLHRQGGGKKLLQKILEGVDDHKNKRTNFNLIIKGYGKFWGRKSIVWFSPPTSNWTSGDVLIKINPELGLEFNGHKYIVKLYFKDDKISSNKATQITALMDKELPIDNRDNTSVGVLDVRRGKLHLKKGNSINTLVLLEAEAKSFETLWDKL